jgi:hypothetical protein
VLCTPSLWQQGWDTEYIRTLRCDSGDSAYVPTTTVYSTFDEIVQPMSGPNASAILGDMCRVGVTNVTSSRPAPRCPLVVSILTMAFCITPLRGPGN